MGTLSQSSSDLGNKEPKGKKVGWLHSFWYGK